MSLRRAMIAVAALALAGFAAPADKVAVADRAVAQFHQRLDEDQVAAIKADADAGQPIAGDRAETILNVLRLRLGRVVSSKQTALSEADWNGGTLIKMTYDTVFADGRMTEEFVYRITDNKAVLFSYEPTGTTDTVVTDFHDRLDAANFSAIEAMIGPDIRNSGNNFRAILARVHTALGMVKSTKCASFNARVEGSRRRIELTYKTVFANGIEVEEFVFYLKAGGPAELAGYYIAPPKSS